MGGEEGAVGGGGGGGGEGALTCRCLPFAKVLAEENDEHNYR